MTHRTCFKAWIVFFLVATLGGAIAGFVFGAILGGILGIAGVDMGTIKIVCGGAGFVVGVPISYFTFYWVVSRFILNAMIPPRLKEQSTQTPQPMPVSITAPAVPPSTSDMH